MSSSFAPSLHSKCLCLFSLSILRVFSLLAETFVNLVSPRTPVFLLLGRCRPLGAKNLALTVLRRHGASCDNVVDPPLRVAEPVVVEGGVAHVLNLPLQLHGQHPEAVARPQFAMARVIAELRAALEVLVILVDVAGTWLAVGVQDDLAFLVETMRHVA